MPRLFLFILLGLCLVMLGCAPTVTVNNNTSFPIRVQVQAGWSVQTVSPSPGESSFVQVSEAFYRHNHRGCRMDQLCNHQAQISQRAIGKLSKPFRLQALAGHPTTQRNCHANATVYRRRRFHRSLLWQRHTGQQRQRNRNFRH